MADAPREGEPGDMLPGTVRQGLSSKSQERTISTVLPERMAKQWRHALDAMEREGSMELTIRAPHRTRTPLARLRVNNRTLVDKAKAGQALADYELLNVLGEGGMGIVYSARQSSIDRAVALKMSKQRFRDVEETEKFLSEVAVTGLLEHPNIVPIYDLGTNSDGVLFYAMKQVKGVAWNGVLPEKTQPENVEILMRVADAVAFAHSKGIIHRDLKPANVMLGEFGEVVLMDWGLAASITEGNKVSRLTGDTACGGTPAYMAPEMALGDPARIGIHSDIYLLGGILFEIVTGQKPHAGRRVQECLYGIARNIIQKTKRTGELLDIAMKAMSTKPEDRYADVKEFQTAIRACQAHSESVVLTTKAQQHLDKARVSAVYADYAQAVYGFQEAMELWPENQAARQGIYESRRSYAECALGKGDLDLAASQIDAADPVSKALATRISVARRDRTARLKRIRRLTVGVVSLTTVVLVVLAIAYVLVRGERDRAESARQRAVAAHDAELSARKLAEAARNEAETARAAEEAQRKLALSETVRALHAEAKTKDALRRMDEAVHAMLQAKTNEEFAEAKRILAELLAERAEDELAQSGMLLEAQKLSLTPEEAARRQQESAAASRYPVERKVPLPDGQHLELVLIPSGEYIMGSPAKEEQRAGEEHLHRVRLSRPFYMGKYEVTRAQWLAVVGDEPPGGAAGDDARRPVTNVPLKQLVRTFLPRLQRLAPRGFEFRLPTEAQWEYACRAGCGTAFTAGADMKDLDAAGWYVLNSQGKPQPVGIKPANSWGLFDMHGNVAEWCSDAYDPNFYLERMIDDPYRKEGVFQVVRGGSWTNLAQHCRSAYRSYAHPENAYNYLGLRVALCAMEGQATR